MFLFQSEKKTDEGYLKQMWDSLRNMFLFGLRWKSPPVNKELNITFLQGKGMMRTYWLVGSDDASKEKTLTNTDKDKAISMNSIDNVIMTDKVEQQGKVHTSILL